MKFNKDFLIKENLKNIENIKQMYEELSDLQQREFLVYNENCRVITFEQLLESDKDIEQAILEYNCKHYIYEPSSLISFAEWCSQRPIYTPKEQLTSFIIDMAIEEEGVEEIMSYAEQFNISSTDNFYFEEYVICPKSRTILLIGEHE